ncbi:GNAT family N-acetyltransferase [Natronorarus salvus]|uniref:GNAT family N-acetyltransferase n=1 Tax=Natronorarus salvus TaxID=3117733 RepID=UPI002F269CD9
MDDDREGTAYDRLDEQPTVDEFLRLREAAGMAERGREAVERGLPGSLVAVTARVTGEVVGIGRVVGDGGSVYVIADVAVDPRYQGEGIGSAIMDRLMVFVGEDAPEGASLTLIADVEGFYEKWGFEPVAPASRGMYLRTGK